MERRACLRLLVGFTALAAGAVRAVDFAEVRPGRRLVFPADHGAHPEFRSEWWYATGWLNPPAGRPLGFQITFFRVRTGIGEDNPSAFAPRQLILAHAAIADPALGRLRHDQRSARAGFGRAGFASERTEVWIDDWRLTQEDARRYRAVVRSDEFAYDLTLAADGPPLLHGDAGFSAKAPDPRHASHYYSRPQLSAAGTLTLAGRTLPVRGQAWLDHEWSSELLADGAQGWDWVGVNLDDGGALMAFRLRGADDSTLWSAATLRSSAGPGQNFPPAGVAFAPLRHWRSPRTGIVYPVAWQLRIGRRVFELQALFDDQELDSRRSTGAIYWEGAVRLFEGGREIGRGYLEMTGYGEPMRLG